jgi:hypothetical protein
MTTNSEPWRPVPIGQITPVQGAEAARLQADARRLNMTAAYMLCLFLGGLKGSGLAMLLINLLSAGVLGVLICLPWSIVDLFLIPGIIREEDARAQSEAYQRYGLALVRGGEPPQPPPALTAS